jgi:hypothetical protein
MAAKARTGAHLSTEQVGVLRSLINNPPEDARAHDQTLRPLLSGLFVACNMLQVSVETRFTAAVLLHRYYAACPVGQRTDAVQWVVASCLFLACKTEEEPRRLRDVINCAHMIRWEKEAISSSDRGTRKRPRNSGDAALQNDQTNASTGISGKIHATSTVAGPCTVQWDPQPPSLDETYWEGKETIVRTEQNVLRWLAFDTVVSHPHRAVIVILQQHQQLSNNTSPETRAVLTAKAWRRLNDAVFSVAALQHGILEMATASVRLALAELEKDTDPSHSLVETGSPIKDSGLSDEAVQAAEQSLQDATESLKCKMTDD